MCKRYFGGRDGEAGEKTFRRYSYWLMQHKTSVGGGGSSYRGVVTQEGCNLGISICLGLPARLSAFLFVPQAEITTLISMSVHVPFVLHVLPCTINAGGKKERKKNGDSSTHRARAGGALPKQVFSLHCGGTTRKVWKHFVAVDAGRW